MNIGEAVSALHDAGLCVEKVNGEYDSLTLDITFNGKTVRILAHDCEEFDFVDDKDLIHHVFCDLGVLK